MIKLPSGICASSPNRSAGIDVSEVLVVVPPGIVVDAPLPPPPPPEAVDVELLLVEVRTVVEVELPGVDVELLLVEDGIKTVVVVVVGSSFSLQELKAKHNPKSNTVILELYAHENMESLCMWRLTY